MFRTSSAPAKAILLGEHAVVHGQPAIAVPLSQIRACVESRASARPLIVRFADKSRASFYWCKDDSDATEPLAKAIGLTARQLAVSSLQGELFVRSDIPVASGLGSGAAVSAALARGVAALQGRQLPDDRLNTIVFEIEKMHHGTPSGIDNTVVVYERPVYFVKDRPVDFIEFKETAKLVVGDTGVRYPTREAVAAVRRQLRAQPRQTLDRFESIGALVVLARRCIETGDHARLGRLMTENHELLRALAVSSVSLDRLVEAALRGGALGAKLSGGGRGGNMIALATNDMVSPVEEALHEAGAKRILVSSLGSDVISA